MNSPHQETPVAGAGRLTAAQRLAPNDATNAGALARDQGHDHWTKIARRWKQLAPPLRPCAEDICSYTEVIRIWTSSFSVPRALILGVTPELYYLSWPAGTDLTAVDHTQGMIDNVWPGPKNAAICAGWTDLPLPDSSRDVVLCDGGLNGLSYPDDLSRLVHELHRVVAPNGLCGIRLFVPPDEYESPDAVLDDLLAGKIANLNLLKLRLWTALQEESCHGLPLAQIWDAVHQVAPDFVRLAARIGWSLEHLSVINTYRDCYSRYYFPTFDEICQVFIEDPGGFVIHSHWRPRYLLGDQCPLVVFRRAA